MYRRTGNGAIEVLLAHPGGPYWSRKDDGAWTLPKGECEDGEEPLACARREFQEETGLAPAGPYAPLGEVRLKSGKRVAAWTFAGDMDPSQLDSNVFEMEWPPKSGLLRQFPEVDRIGWFSLEAARVKLLPAQAAFIDRLVEALGG
ncbi:MAG: hypothetical protein JWQ33_1334 [Ramlibacter sp.]|nr:hypothetical protein [Ramlibacter sp.]